MSLEVPISVRTLVEYVFNTGSIDARFRSQTSLLDGTRIHQKSRKRIKKMTKKRSIFVQKFPMKISYIKLTADVMDFCFVMAT